MTGWVWVGECVQIELVRLGHGQSGGKDETGF
jgi:hypothetical protein